MIHADFQWTQLQQVVQHERWGEARNRADRNCGAEVIENAEHWAAELLAS